MWSWLCCGSAPAEARRQGLVLVLDVSELAQVALDFKFLPVLQHLSSREMAEPYLHATYLATPAVAQAVQVLELGSGSFVLRESDVVINCSSGQPASAVALFANALGIDNDAPFSISPSAVPEP